MSLKLGFLADKWPKGGIWNNERVVTGYGQSTNSGKAVRSRLWLPVLADPLLSLPD